MRSMRLTRVAATAAVAIAVLAGVPRPAAAQASKLNLVGAVDVFLAPGGNLALDFVMSPSAGTGSVFTLGPQTGVFAGLTSLTPGLQFDLVFGPAPAATPIPSTLLSIGGYTFTATAFGPGNVAGTPVRLTDDGASTVLSFSVLGTVTGPGFAAPSPVLGSYAASFPGMTRAELLAAIDGHGALPSSMAASFVTPTSLTAFAAVPEPSTWALVATGGLLVGATARRRSRSV